MTQQQGQPNPGRPAPNQRANWSAPGQGQRWAPPAQGQRWAPPAQGQWGPPPGRFTQPRPGRPRKKSSPLRYVFGLGFAVTILVLAGFVLAASFTDDSSDVAFQNENYEVPAVTSAPPSLPAAPKTFDEAYPIVEDNALYDQTVASPVRCDTPDVSAQSSSAKLEQDLNDYMGCQLRVWGPAISAAGYTNVRPLVTVYRDQVVSACGTMRGEKAVNAFYCGGDQRVFYSTLLTQALPIASRPHVIELILAHEFGHAVQARTGIIVTAHLLAANASSEEESLEFQRRIETQADCLSGIFMRSVAESRGLSQGDVATFDEAWRQFGDDTATRSPTPGDHGTGASRQRWGNLGLSTADVGQCNTFTAPSDQVR